MIIKRFFSVFAVCLLCASTAQGAFLVEVDTDGLDDGNLALSPNFSFGGDTTTASTSSESFAFGMNGGDSIFGGDGNALPDTYVVTHSPDSEADNLPIAAGTDLGNGNTASGFVGGVPGTYNVYATWPFTTGVSAGPTEYTIATAGDSTIVSIDQNNQGNAWTLIGSIDYASGAITVTQVAGANTFVSMRLAGILFERVPEPSGVGLAVLTLLMSAFARRR